MYDELTQVDIQKMRDEIDYRTRELRPKLIEEVKTARAFGDLSENFEYKAAKREKNRNDSRIRYLQRMVDTAKVITDRSTGDTVGLFDSVVIYIPDDDEEQTIRLVTTLRQNALEGLISKESPVGRAVLGKRVGDRVYVDMGGGKGYMFGTILGVIFLSSLSTGFNLMNVNAYYQQIIKGVVLLVAIAFNARSGNTFKRKEKAK